MSPLKRRERSACDAQPANVGAQLPHVIFAALVLTASPAFAQDIAFADKTIQMTIGFAPGGGVDLFGRTFGRHVTRYLPGNPGLVVHNQPGAGGVVALNDWPRRVDPNGLAVTVGAQSQTDPDALRETKARFDPATFRMVGGLGAYSQGLFIRNEALARLTDKSKPPVVMGLVGSTLRGASYTVLWGAAFLGWNVKWVKGYPSTGEVRQALERGEVEMATFGATKDFENLYKIGGMTVLAQTGHVQDGGRIRRAILQDAPVFSDLVRGKIADPQARAAFAYWEDVSQIGMWVALPPAAPDRVVEAWVKAFNATVEDPRFQEDYGRVDPDYLVARKAEIERAVAQLGKVPPETLRHLGEELARQGFGGAP